LRHVLARRPPILTINMSARVVCKLKAFKLRQAACTIGKLSLPSADHSVERGRAPQRFSRTFEGVR
ncbi:MAG: hypothetical protein ACTS44_01600, partial [Candidatus Hodgkinia cicadicola]